MATSNTKQCGSFVSRAPPHCIHVASILHSLPWLPLWQRVISKTVVFARKCIQSCSDVPSATQCNVYKVIHNYNRHCQDAFSAVINYTTDCFQWDCSMKQFATSPIQKQCVTKYFEAKAENLFRQQETSFGTAVAFQWFWRWDTTVETNLKSLIVGRYTYNRKIPNNKSDSQAKSIKHTSCLHWPEIKSVLASGQLANFASLCKIKLDMVAVYVQTSERQFQQSAACTQQTHICTVCDIHQTILIIMTIEYTYNCTATASVKHS